mgnify:CR=1 FL=1
MDKVQKAHAAFFEMPNAKFLPVSPDTFKDYAEQLTKLAANDILKNYVYFEEIVWALSHSFVQYRAALETTKEYGSLLIFLDMLRSEATSPTTEEDLADIIDAFKT